MRNSSSFCHNVDVKAILFDCDGTLVDSEYAHYLSWQFALQKYDEDLTLEEYSFFVGKSAETNAQLLAKKINKDCSQEILQNKRTHYDLLRETGFPAIEATVHFVHRLHKEKVQRGLKLGVASAARKDEIISHLKHLGIYSFFDVILSGKDDLADYHDPEGTNKPKPYVYLHAAKLLGISPKQCVVIEDSHAGVRAGADAGCITIAVPNSHTHQHDFSRAHLKKASFANIEIDDFLEEMKGIMSRT